MADCEGCHARIEWRANTKTGKAAPVDPTPVANGNVVLERDGTYRVLTKAEITRLDNPGMLDDPPPDRFTLHFASCPSASRFRRCGRCHRTPCVCEDSSAHAD